MNHVLLKAISCHKHSFYVYFRRYIFIAFYWTKLHGFRTSYLLHEDFKCINVHFVSVLEYISIYMMSKLTYIKKRSNLSLQLVIEKRLHCQVVKMLPPSDGEVSSAWMF